MRQRLAAWCALLLMAAGVSAAAQSTAQVGAVTPADRVLGNAAAPVTLIEYGSLTCPHCAAFDTDILPRIKREWIDSGKVKYVFRDFPLDGLALRAAALTRCAPPERFFDYVDVLYRDQPDWAHMPDQNQALERAGNLGGLDKATRQACLADAKLTDAAANERLVAEQHYGVKATPTFFINGTIQVGALPYPDFAKKLDEAIKH